MFYNKASAHILPSFFEGFGLTVLEAMACGCPIIASNRASIPEIVGNAGILIDPEKPEIIASAIADVLTNNNLQTKLIRAGLEQVTHFSWETTIHKTIEVYEQCMHYKK